VRSKATASLPLEDRTIVLDLRRGRYRALEAMGSRIWELLERPLRPDEIVDRLAEEYEAPRTRIDADARAFLADLGRTGLARSWSASMSAPSPVECGAALVGIRGLLKTCGMQRALAALRWVSRDRPSMVNLAVAMRGARAVRVAAALYPGRAECLERSMTLCFVLRRRGIQAKLRLGVDPYLFDGHAWVEHDGHLLDETTETLKPFVHLTDIEP